MREEKRYYCENCNEEFINHNDCELHEVKCMNKFYIYEQNVKMAVEDIKRSFEDNLKSITYECNGNVETCDYLKYVNYDFEIIFELNNGNKGMLNPNRMGACCSSFFSKGEIYKALKEEIIKKMPTEFVGKLCHKWDEDGYIGIYVDSINIEEIVEVFENRKVKIVLLEKERKNEIKI